jgi:hypothetical protein
VVLFSLNEIDLADAATVLVQEGARIIERRPGVDGAVPRATRWELLATHVLHSSSRRALHIESERLARNCAWLVSPGGSSAATKSAISSCR